MHLGVVRKAEGSAVISGCRTRAESLVRCRTPSVLTATGSSSWLCCLDSKQAKLKGSLKIMQIMQRALKASPCWALPRLSLCSWNCSFCWGKMGAAGEVLPLNTPLQLSWAGTFCSLHAAPLEKPFLELHPNSGHVCVHCHHP